MKYKNVGQYPLYEQVLLHDPRETPLIEDLGFAVAPGTQTLVAIEREETIHKNILMVHVISKQYQDQIVS